MFLRFKNCIVNQDSIVSVLDDERGWRSIVLSNTAEILVTETLEEIMDMLTRAK